MFLSICLITTHPNPADHFSEYVQVYEEKGIPCKVIAEKSVAYKFSQVKSEVVEMDFSLNEDELIDLLSNEIKSQNIVITDIANQRFAKFHKWLKQKHPSIKRAVYYDNPEKYVPGGYSQVADQVIEHAQLVIFANRSLVKKGVEKAVGIPIDLSQKDLVGIGYYPKTEANQVAALRQNKDLRSRFLKQNRIEDQGQKIYVYVGGANEEYYEKAFPHFLKLVLEIRDNPTIWVLQQHPRAKAEGNRDAQLIEKSRLDQFFISNLSTPEALAIADGVFYYQTSMAAQFVFAKIPLIAQVGHEQYDDLLVRAGYPCITRAEEFVHIPSPASVGSLEEELGMDPNWKENLLSISIDQNMIYRNASDR